MPRTPIERTLTLKGQLALAYFLTSEFLYLPIVVIIILLLITFALVLYVVLLRIAFNSRQRSKKRQFEIWQNLILRYLSREASSQEIVKEVKKKYFGLFAEFMEKYLETLRGGDFENLTDLLKKMGILGHNLKKLHSRKKWDRVYAAFFLGLMRDREATTEVQEGLKDKDYLVSFACAMALAKIGDKQNLKETLSLLTGREDLGPDRAAECLLEFGRGISTELALLLSREDIHLRWKYLIIDLIGYWQDLAVGPTLLGLLDTSPDKETKRRCIKSLGQMSYLESVPALAVCLDDENGLIRSEAARSLGMIGASEYSDKMVKSLNDTNWWVRYNSARALANFGEHGMALLKKMARQKGDSHARDISAHILSEIKLLGG